MSEDFKGIEQTLAEWAQFFAEGDVAGLVSLVTPDAEFWTHGMPPIVGRNALREAFEAFFELYSVQQRFEILERLTGDGWVLLRGVEFNTLVPKAEGESEEYTQRAFSVLRQDKDGRWRFLRGMTNQESPQEP